MAGMLREATGIDAAFISAVAREAIEADSCRPKRMASVLPMTRAATMPPPPVRADPHPSFWKSRRKKRPFTQHRADPLGRDREPTDPFSTEIGAAHVGKVGSSE